jgi:hypothetical protein
MEMIRIVGSAADRRAVTDFIPFAHRNPTHQQDVVPDGGAGADRNLAFDHDAVSDSNPAADAAATRQLGVRSDLDVVGDVEAG